MASYLITMQTVQCDEAIPSWKIEFRRRGRTTALCFAVLLASTMMAAPVAHAELSVPDQTECKWFPIECDPPGPPPPQYTAVKTALNPELASEKARAEADIRCSGPASDGYEILKLRVTKLRTQWQSTITFVCKPA